MSSKMDFTSFLCVWKRLAGNLPKDITRFTCLERILRMIVNLHEDSTPHVVIPQGRGGEVTIRHKSWIAASQCPSTNTIHGLHSSMDDLDQPEERLNNTEMVTRSFERLRSIRFYLPHSYFRPILYRMALSVT